GGARFRAPRARLECRLALHPIAGDQPRYPPLRDPVITGDLRLRTALDEDSGDNQTSLRHQLKLTEHLFRCLETPHSHVLKHHTVPATKAIRPPERSGGRLRAPQVVSGRPPTKRLA